MSAFMKPALAGFFCALVLASGDASAASLKQQIVGTWLFSSTYDIHADGSKTVAWNEHVKGFATFDRNGRYATIIVDGDRAKTGGLPTVPVGKLVAHFGTYTVNEKEHGIVYHVERNSAPDGEGIDRPAKVTFTKDTMEIVGGPIPSPSGPFYSHTIWVRAK